MDDVRHAVDNVFDGGERVMVVVVVVVREQGAKLESRRPTPDAMTPRGH